MNLPTGPSFAFEVDGFGGQIFMDDGNIPSLLSLPYLDFVEKNNEYYLNTRKALLSTQNSYFFKGNWGEGIGGPHTGYGMIWPMSILVRALTTDVYLNIVFRMKQK